MLRSVFACLLGLSLFAAGCGGKKGSLELDIVVSPVDDPFFDATQVRVTCGTNVKTADVVAGKFSLKLDFKPLKDATPIVVEAIDAMGNVIASGKTPPVALIAGIATQIGVWVGRPGKIVPAKAALPSARTDMAVTAVDSLGALMVGGRLATGGPVGSTLVYNIFTHAVVETTATTTARAGAVATGGNNAQGAVFGGATSGTIGAYDMPVATAELFDPTVGNGLWSPLPTEPTDARSFANLTVLGSGVGFISGGLGANGQPLNTAALLQTDGTARITAISSPMVGARSGHAVAAAKFPDGDGAILFGGSTDPNVPACERLIGQSFSTYDLGGVPGRTGATATTLGDGSILIVGGKSATGVEASGLHIIPNTPPTVTVLDAILSVPRQHHTAVKVGDDVLVCGGDDGNNTVHATCDKISSIGLTRTTLNTSIARTLHNAVQLETGPMLILGGVGSDGKPLNIIEIYTP